MRRYGTAGSDHSENNLLIYTYCDRLIKRISRRNQAFVICNTKKILHEIFAKFLQEEPLLANISVLSEMRTMFYIKNNQFGDEHLCYTLSYYLIIYLFLLQIITSVKYFLLNIFDLQLK